MQKKVDRILLQSYFRGDCDKDQLTIISHYLNDPGYKESLDEFLLSEWTNIPEDKVQPLTDTEESYKRFLELTGQNNNLPITKKAKKLYGFPLYRSWKIAAAIVITIGLAGFVLWSDNSKRAFYSQWVSVRNEAGKKTFFYLPDSSKVYLSAASSLEYNKGYGITNRELRLKGEAYFVVKHEGKYPFSVITGKITTVDIGTEFNIRFLKNSPAIEVAVAKGSVEVLNNADKNSKKLATLYESEQLSFDTALQMTSISLLTANKIGAWRNGELVFEKKSLKEVAKELERYYDLTIAFTNAASSDIVITTKLKNATVEEALDIIALTAGVKIKRNTNHVFIE